MMLFPNKRPETNDGEPIGQGSNAPFLKNINEIILIS